MSLSKSELLEQLRQMDAYEFEELVADVWEAQGWNTTVTSGSSDRGIDIIAKKNGLVKEKTLIQAKRYSAKNKVGGPEVREYSSLQLQEEGVDAVIIVTTSSFSRQARNIADDLNVKLVDSDSLVDYIKREENEGILNRYSISSEYENQSSNHSEKRLGQDTAVTCPYCQKKLSDSKKAFLQHWRDSKKCTNSVTNFPWLDFPKEISKVPCPYCNKNVNNSLSAFCSHWLQNDSCQLPTDIDPIKIPEKVKQDSVCIYPEEDSEPESSAVGRGLHRRGRRRLFSDFNKTNNESRRGIENFSPNHTKNLSQKLKDGSCILEHPKIKPVKKESLRAYLTNQYYGIGVGQKNNIINPCLDRSSVFLITDERVICIIGKENRDEVIKFDMSDVNLSKYHSGITKNRVEIRLYGKLRIEAKNEEVHKIHLWLPKNEDGSDLVNIIH